jgi:hypothetical protein
LRISDRRGNTPGRIDGSGGGGGGGGIEEREEQEVGGGDHWAGWRQAEARIRREEAARAAGEAELRQVMRVHTSFELRAHISNSACKL